MEKLFAILISLTLIFNAAGALAQLEVQEFPAIEDMYSMLDLTDPYRTVISGLFRQSLEIAQAQREFYVYIGSTNHQQEPNVTLIPDADVDPVEFLEASGWKEIADEEGLILLIAVPATGEWDVQTDIDYLNELWTVSHVRNWYNCQKHNGYMAAYGDGATLGQMWAMQRVTPQKLVSFATFGDFEVEKAYMDEVNAIETRVEGVTVADIPMPCWMIIPEMTESIMDVVDYWNSANDVAEEVLFSDNATAIYSARNNGIDSLINEQSFIAQTRYTVAQDADDYANAARTGDVWDFLSSFIRPVGYANNELRPARS
ncbi:MAG: hypothetical protein Q4D04_09680, partial [Clostridia bacterium]|nr:hypothetical protein [Clostridia bacterium]